ncbi:hypothetical protein B9T50_08605 [Zymomonas mobilis subsp. mobilis]|nr:hypothetical protein B9T50_08605 [Zymomonas mobilis subsp. mobilis]
MAGGISKKENIPIPWQPSAHGHAIGSRYGNKLIRKVDEKTTLNRSTRNIFRQSQYRMSLIYQAKYNRLIGNKINF